MWLFFICAVASLIGLIYYMFASQYKHYEKLGIPGPKPTFLLGNIPNLIKQKRSVTYD